MSHCQIHWLTFINWMLGYFQYSAPENLGYYVYLRFHIEDILVAGHRCLFISMLFGYKFFFRPGHLYFFRSSNSSLGFNHGCCVGCCVSVMNQLSLAKHKQVEGKDKYFWKVKEMFLHHVSKGTPCEDPFHSWRFYSMASK